jgi:predicted ATP-grasp superfamily ATP-dependent carboligase
MQICRESTGTITSQIRAIINAMSQRSKREPVFFLGDSMGSLGAIQSLGSKGVPCWVCAPERRIAAWSRFARYWHIPDPHENDERIIERLRALSARTGGRPVLIPGNDYYALVLARIAPELGHEFAVCGGPLSSIELLCHKHNFADWGVEHGLPCLPGVLASEIDAPDAYPVVVKPINKFTLQFTAKNLPAGVDPMRYQFELIRNEAEWRAYKEELRDNLDQFIVQTLLAGTSADTYSIGVYADRNSRLLGTFVLRKIRGYPALSGETKAGQNDHVPEWIIVQVRQIIETLQYSGILEFEYRREPTTGVFHLLDANPRCWTWIALCAASPADLPWIAYQDLCGSPQAPVTETRSPGSIKYVFLISDFLSVFYRYRRDHPAWNLSPRQWWRSLAAEKLVVAEFNQFDWSAGLMILFTFLRSASRRIARLTTRRS